MADSSLEQRDPLTTTPPPFGETPFRPNRALPLLPIAGIIAFSIAKSVYRPIDEGILLAIELPLFFLSLLLNAYVRNRVRRGADVASLFPFTTWIAFGPAFVALVIFVNGGLDRSPVEPHTEFVTRKYVIHSRSTSYNVEFTSWRAAPFEKVSVPLRLYGQLKVNDPIMVELHKGALHIPWMGAIRRSAGAGIR